MTDDIDDLIERLGELDPSERRELSRRMQADWARRVGDARRAYHERLEEENLVGGGGMVFQPIPDEEEEWFEYCREHPDDPICLAGAPPAVGGRLSDFLDIRREYLDRLEEEGLLGVETASPGGFRPVARRRGDPSPQPSVERRGSPVGLTPPPDPWPWPPEWPPWPWPWPGPGPRPGPWPYAGNGDPVPLPASPSRRFAETAPWATIRRRPTADFGPYGSRRGTRGRGSPSRPTSGRRGHPGRGPDPAPIPFPASR